MNFVANAMPKYDHRQHILPDWLAELEQRLVNAIQDLKDVRKQIAAHKANQSAGTAMSSCNCSHLPSPTLSQAYLPRLR